MGELTIVGHDQQALSLSIETPDREHPRLIGHHIDDGGPTLRIVGGRDDPGRFVEQVVDEVGPHPDRSTVDGDDLGLDIDSLAEFGDDPVDRHPPSAMISSQTRRLPNPTRARIFCSRSSGCGSAGSLVLATVISVGRLGVGAIELIVVGSDAQSPLERLDHVSLREELAERREILDRIDPESLEKRGCRAVQHGLTGTRITSNLVDIPRCCRVRITASTLTPRIEAI